MKKLLSLVIALIMIVSVAALASCGKSEPTSFATPEEHLTYVWAKQVNQSSDAALDQYEEARTSLTGAKMTTEVKVTLGEGLKSMLKEMVDLDSINSLSYKFESNATLEKNAGDATLFVNDKEVLNGSFVFDATEGTVFAKVPALYKDYFKIVLNDQSESGIDLEDFDLSSDMDVEVFKDLLNALPTEDQLKDLVAKYIVTALDSLKGVTEEEGDYTVDDITVNAKMVKVKITASTVLDIAKDILTKVKEDKDIKSIVDKIGEATKEKEPGDAYKEFQDAIDKALQSIENTRKDVDENVAIDLLFVTNEKNEMLAIEAEATESDGAKSTFRMASLDKDGKYVIDVSATSRSMDIAIQSKGVKSGDKLTGPVKILSNKDEVFSFNIKDFDIEALKNGTFSGAIVIPSEQIQKLLRKTQQSGSSGMNMSGMIVAALGTYDITIEGTATAKDVNLTLSMANAQQSFASVQYKASVSGKPNIPSPKADKTAEEVMSDPNAMTNFADNLKANLKDAGVSDRLTDLLTESLGGMMGGYEEFGDPTGA
ncbi:MAG: hypothetical protein J6023_03215 [Clostridia bacterium]|nr:hypothetical protein [Clostridia bacterium]